MSEKPTWISGSNIRMEVRGVGWKEQASFPANKTGEISPRRATRAKHAQMHTKGIAPTASG